MNCIGMFGLSLCLIVLGNVGGQLIIPKRPLGFVYDNRSMNALVHLDVHMGPVCPNSRDAFPTIKAVADHYGPERLRLTMHLFPLPYHHNSFLAAMGAHVFQVINPGTSAWLWFQAVYDNIDKFSNTNTADMTTTQVIKMLSTYAGLGKGPMFISGMKETEFDTATRTAWKYTCTRGISGTPTFLLNDVIVQAEPSWDLATWQKVIDPLLMNFNSKACPSKTKHCEWLPGKVECCTQGEACIPNVGCRC